MEPPKEEGKGKRERNGAGLGLLMVLVCGVEEERVREENLETILGAM